LLGRDGKLLAVVEAKKSSKDPAIGQEQGEQYCCNIQKKLGGKLPFCFYTIGLEIYFWDLENCLPRKVVGYPTRDDLERLQYIREYRKRLSDELINTEIAGRDYQIRAIRAVMEGIEKKQRKFLLVILGIKNTPLFKKGQPYSLYGFKINTSLSIYYFIISVVSYILINFLYSLV
jgi:type I restriction enzyme R subunit